MKRGCEESGVKRIRIHDLRHSHVSLLIEMGFSVVAIADRVGHRRASTLLIVTLICFRHSAKRHG